MRKPYRFTQRHPFIHCIVCGRALKLNVIERKQKTPEYCYKHWKALEQAVREGRPHQQ